MSPFACMRRVLVIFLVLLFPLNVFALSLSVATMPAAALAQAAGAKDRLHVPPALADAGAVSGDDTGSSDTGSGDRGDIDPDEPPAGGDIHYIVGHAGCLHIAGLSSAAPALHDAASRCHSVPPPVKPPRAA